MKGYLPKTLFGLTVIMASLVLTKLWYMHVIVMPQLYQNLGRYIIGKLPIEGEEALNMELY